MNIAPLTTAELVRRARSAEMAEPLDRLCDRSKEYAVPFTELRAALDAEMGDKTFTQELHKMREDR